MAVLYVKFSPWLALHLPPQYSGASRYIAHVQYSLYRAAKSDLDRFLRLGASWGLYSVVAGPLYEELTFRGLPILAGRAVLHRSTALAARFAVSVIAVLACVLFAWMHFRRWGVFPVPQFLFGAVAWLVAWHRGLRYSVLMHVTTNLLFFAMQMEWVLMAAG